MSIKHSGKRRGTRFVACLFVLVALLLSSSGLAQPQPSSPIELHVWGLNMGIIRAGTLAMVAAFEQQHPGVKVVIGPSDRGSDLQKLLCGVIGDSPPDVFKREAGLFGDIAARGILRPLDDFIEADKTLPDGVRKENYAPGIWESTRGQDGKIYGIVEGTNCLFLAYNKKVFREVGLDPERPPATWAEWIEVSKRVLVRDERGAVTRWPTMIVAPYKEDDLTFYIAQLGGKVLSDDGRTSLLDSPEVLQALTFIRDIYSVMGGAAQFTNFRQAQEAVGVTKSPMGHGRVAMSVEGDSIISEFMRDAPDADVGLAPVPRPEGGRYITTSSRHGVFLIPKNARHPKEAWEFIRFANSPEGMTIFCQAIADEIARTGKTGQTYPGMRADRRTREVLLERFAPTQPNLRAQCEQASELMDALPFEPVPRSPVYAIIRDECVRAVDRVVSGGMDPQQALAAADLRVQQQLDLYYARENLPIFRWTPVWIALGALCAGCYLFLRLRSREERAYTALQRHENRMGILFISPWLVGFLVLIAGPMVFSLAMSLCDYDVIHPARYVGLHNYTSLFSDPLFLKSLWNTVVMVAAIPLGMAIALGIALLLNLKVRGMPLYRAAFYLPAITPAVAASVLWYALLNPNGLINDGLHTIGIHATPAWLGSEYWSKPAIVLMGLWGAGGGMILWLAGLQGIPPQLYEAASIDGASRLRQFRSVTLPMLTPYIFYSLITGIIGVFQIFAQALILTGGGPNDSTLFYVYYLFNNAFRYFKMGYASAQAWVLFLIILIITLVQIKVSKRWVHYD